MRLRKRLGLLVSAALCLFLTSPTFAQTLLSPNYKFSESTIGQNGLPNSSSPNYSASSSTGDFGVGPSLGTNYGFQGGSQTTPDPRLAVAVTGTGVNLPNFSVTTPSMATTTFQVLNYTSYKYVVIMTGDPPKNGNHAIQPMATQDVSTPSFEQFGINLIANATPAAPQSIGANPDNGLAGFAFGLAAPQYADNGKFKYVDGDTIAKADKSGGYTNYTITYLVNVSALTQGGQYTTNQSLVVVGTY